MANEKIKVEQPKVRKKTSGYGLLGTKYKKNPKYRDKPRSKRVDIREMNEETREKDPFEEAIKEVERKFDINLAEAKCGEGTCGSGENEEQIDPHALDKDQLTNIVNYAHEDILQGEPADDHRVMDALQTALDDVPGFETGDRAEMVQRLLGLYHQLYR